MLREFVVDKEVIRYLNQMIAKAPFELDHFIAGSGKKLSKINTILEFRIIEMVASKICITTEPFMGRIFQINLKHTKGRLKIFANEDD